MTRIERDECQVAARFEKRGAYTTSVYSSDTGGGKYKLVYCGLVYVHQPTANFAPFPASFHAWHEHTPRHLLHPSSSAHRSHLPRTGLIRLSFPARVPLTLRTDRHHVFDPVSRDDDDGDVIKYEWSYTAAPNERELMLAGQIDDKLQLLLKYQLI